MKRLGACVCVAAFLLGAAGSAVLGFSTGPRNPGADVSLNENDIVFRVNGNAVTWATVGDPVTINMTIRNNGSSPSAKVSVTVLYDDSNTFINSSNLTVPVPSSGYVEYEVVWDTSNVAVGDHKINITLVELLSNDDNLTNNRAFKDITIRAVPRPHVYVDSIILKDAALVGEAVMITANLKNDGTKASELGDTVKFMVGTQLLPGGLKAYQGPLPADGSIAVVDYEWNTTNLQAGQYFIKVEVTSSGYRCESHPIVLSFPSANVYIYKIEMDKSEVLQGGSVLISGKLRNNGTAPAVDEEVWFLVDKATSPTLGCYTKPFNIQNKDQDVNFQFTWDSTDAAAGPHTFTVRVPGSSDPKAQATTSVLNVIARTPRVNLTEFSAKPADVKSGESVTLAAKLENTGSADAYNQEVRFYMGSTDTYPLAIKKVNVRVGVPSWANATYMPETGENNTNLNFIAVFINPMWENETRNGSVLVRTTVLPRPDLVVTSVDVVRSMIVNNEYTVLAVISNIGKAGATNFTVKFNLGTELPFLIRGLDLANGQSMNVNWTVRPSVTGQNLRLKVEVNAEHNQAWSESNEFNNIFESIQDIVVKDQPRAKIELQRAEPNRKSFKVKTGEKATVTLTVTVKNSGEKDGMVFLTLKEGLVVVLSENVTVEANSTRSLNYKWNITAAGTHTAKVIIEGADAGLITSQITSVDLTEERSWWEPGFELLVVAAAVGFVVILAGRRRK